MTKFAKSVTLAALAATVFGVSALMSATAARAEPLGSTCSDCAFFRGEYSVENHTGITLAYQFRWGPSAAWRTVVLNDGERKTHTYHLGDDPTVAVPTPYVRFDSRVCGGSSCNGPTVWGQRKMHFSAVMKNPGFTSAGTPIKRGKPTRYVFSVSGGDFGEFKVDIVPK
jgi:hypothetical protein